MVSRVTNVADSASQATDMSVPVTAAVAKKSDDAQQQSIAAGDSPIADISESEKDFSKRAGKKIDLDKPRKTKIKNQDSRLPEVQGKQKNGQENC